MVTAGQTVTVGRTQYVVESVQGFEGTPLVQAEMAKLDVVAMAALRKPRGTKVTFHHVMTNGTIALPFA